MLMGVKVALPEGCCACPPGVSGQVGVYLFEPLFAVVDHVPLRDHRVRGAD
jgi:hypothetical protein